MGHRMIDDEGISHNTYMFSFTETRRGTMERIYRALVLALYQLTLLMGILLLPVAVVTRRLGLRIPVDRAIERLNEAYETSAR